MHPAIKPSHTRTVLHLGRSLPTPDTGGSTRAACGAWHRPSPSRAGHLQTRAGDHWPYWNPLIWHTDHRLCPALHSVAFWGEEEGGEKERPSLLPSAPTKQKPDGKSVRSHLGSRNIDWRPRLTPRTFNVNDHFSSPPKCPVAVLLSPSWEIITAICFKCCEQKALKSRKVQRQHIKLKSEAATNIFWCCALDAL